MEQDSLFKNKTASQHRQNIIKTIVNIFILLVIITALTFAFKFVNNIRVISLKITVMYLIYIAFILVVLFFCYLGKIRIKELGFTEKKVPIQILIGLAIAIGLGFLIGVLPIMIGGSDASLIGKKQTNLTNIIFLMITDVIFIGTCEELIFRGYIQTKINKLSNHKWVGVLIAAALFGLWHIINGVWFQVLFTFLIGCVFGFCRAYLKNCSLLSVIIAHGFYDALLVVIGIVML